jgi:hypothetical protein
MPRGEYLAKNVGSLEVADVYLALPVISCWAVRRALQSICMLEENGHGGAAG